VDRAAGVTYRCEDCPEAEKSHSGSRHFFRVAAAVAVVLVFCAVNGLVLKFAGSSRTLELPRAAQPLAQAAEPTVAEPEPAEEEDMPAPESPPARAEQATASPPPAAPPPPPAAIPPAEPPAPAVAVRPRAPEPPADAPAAPVRSNPSPWRRVYTSEELAAMLRQVPELSLQHGPAPATPDEGKAAREAFWKELEKAVKEQRDQYMPRLVARRPDLATLPFRDAERCQLDRAAAKKLQDTSLEVRELVSEALREAGRVLRTESAPPDRTAGSDPVFRHAASTICHGLLRNPSREHYGELPALDQILSGEPASLRLTLAWYLQYPPDSEAAAAVLARRALFDTSAEVRKAAIGGLYFIPQAKYLPLVLDGLRYPWAPVNFHAAEVLVTLRAEEAVPELIKLLNRPDPCEPFETDKDGKKILVRRELVRLNHHSNCLLCHAPSFDRADLVRGPVPEPSAPLPPPLSNVYYGPRGSRGLFVRADVTYLRQDFSEVQPVANPGSWPNEQRFDFLVRVRPLTEAETAAWRNRDRFVGPRQLPASQQAAIFALAELTRLDGGFTAASWERARRAAPRTGNAPESAP
jgi:hypothetical protein